jgi:hypothetical protein
MAGLYPADRAADKADQSLSPYQMHQETGNNVKEYLVAVEEVKILQEKLKVCYMKSGPNHFEDCKELRETLWTKMNTPNYGAPGPARSVRRPLGLSALDIASVCSPSTLRLRAFPHPSLLRGGLPLCAQTSKYGINVPREATEEE